VTVQSEHVTRLSAGTVCILGCSCILLQATVVEQAGRLEARMVADFVAARVSRLDQYAQRGVGCCLLLAVAAATAVAFLVPLPLMLSSVLNTHVSGNESLARPDVLVWKCAHCGPALQRHGQQHDPVAAVLHISIATVVLSPVTRTARADFRE
jgi:hypothetical protein